MQSLRAIPLLIDRFRTRRYHRPIFVAALLTLLTSGILLGLVSAMQWGGYSALHRDTQVVLAQARQELLRALTSRRGTLTFIRDTINQRPDLTTTHLQAIGISATQHTRHLLGTGLIRSRKAPQWWYGPLSLSSQELSQLNRSIVQRTQLRGVWNVPSTFIVITSRSHVVLAMMEPLDTPTYSESALLGAFDFKALLEDFVNTRLSPHYPMQVFYEDQLLVRSDDWQSIQPGNKPILVETELTIDSVPLMLEMQPGSTRVVRTLSWFTLLLIGLSVVAGLGVTGIVWILAARTWLLQQAVTRRTKVLRRTLKRLRQLATTDELTGLSNRRFFLERLSWEYDRAIRYHRPLSCLMIDINGFKQVNDWLGHQVGDVVLKRVAQHLKPLLRQSDILARFGGDEFIVLLPETNTQQAMIVAEKLRRLRVSVAEGQRRVPPISLSVGISSLNHEGHPRTLEDLIQTADQALYASKQYHRTTMPSPGVSARQPHSNHSSTTQVPTD